VDGPVDIVATEVPRFRLILAFLATLLLPMTVFAGDVITVHPDAPLFAVPDLDSEPLGTLGKAAELEVLERRRVYIEDKAMWGTREWHPMMIFTDLCRVDLGTGRPVWVSRDIVMEPTTRQQVPVCMPRLRDGAVFIIALAGLLFLGLFGITRGGYQSLGADWQPEPGARGIFARVCPAATFILVYFTLAGFTRLFAGNAMLHPVDEKGYFRVAAGISQWIITKDWDFTIGWPLLLVPFIKLAGAAEYYDIVHVVSAVNSMLLTPIRLLLMYLIACKLYGSRRGPFFAMLLVVVMPFFFFPVEYHDSLVFKAIPALPGYSPGSYRLYYIFHAIGYGGLSDTASTCAILFCVYCAMRKPFLRRHIVMVSALFSFACLIRIANIMFAPLIAFQFYHQLREEHAGLREYLLSLVAALATFLALFSPQFWINAHNYGSCWTFPYILHGACAHEGFELDLWSSGIRFLFGTNFAYIAFGLTGIAFTKRRDLRCFLAFVTLPLLLFYSGYAVVGNNPIRFIQPIYGFLIVAIVAAPQWKDVPRSRKIVLAAVLLANVLLVSPCHRFDAPFLFDMDRLSWGSMFAKVLAWGVPAVSIGLICVFCRQRRVFVITISLLLFYHAGSRYLLTAAAIAMLAWACVDFAVGLRTEFLRVRAASPE